VDGLHSAESTTEGVCVCRSNYLGQMMTGHEQTMYGQALSELANQVRSVLVPTRVSRLYE